MLLAVAAALAQSCPPNATFVEGVGCLKNETEIDFEEAEITAAFQGPSLEFVMERKVGEYPCEELRRPGTIDAWETCLHNYYGSPEIAALSYEIASRFVETQACPSDTKDVDMLRQVAEHYGKHPRTEDLSALHVTPIDRTSSRVEPHLPLMCGYNAAQERWYEPRNFFCEGTDCFPQPASGAKDKIRYTPFRTAPNLYRLQSDDPRYQSISEGGAYGHLRVIPLGNNVFLTTAGGMYGNIFYYGLVIAPTEEAFLRRACHKELYAQDPVNRLTRGQARRLLAEGRRLLGQADALVRLKEVAERLTSGADDSASLRLEAERLMGVVSGKLPAKKASEAPCVRYQARYPRRYERARLAGLGKPEEEQLRLGIAN
ncbi:MAG: hypothetical protein ACOZNI_06285 [Myxococcota bacterium]